MEVQSCMVENIYIYQDSQSAILLETSGMKSVDKSSGHIKIKYFFVTDRMKDKELKVIYCPTKEMVIDFFTKFLQGVLFIGLRISMIGIHANDDNIIYVKKQ